MGKTPLNRAIQAIEHALPSSVEVRRAEGNRVHLNGIPFRVTWAGEGWLRDLRSALRDDRQRPEIVVARRMSPGARKKLAELGIGFVDETGAAEIVRGTLVVAKTGLKTEPTEARAGWTPSVFAVAEALLGGSKATVQAVGDATGLSTGSCTNALRFLEGEGLLVAGADRGPRSGRRILELDALLDVYASAVASETAPAGLDVGVSWRDPVAGLVEIGSEWDSAEVGWACTGVLASMVLAPHLTSIGRAEVYVDVPSIAGLDAAASAAGLRPIEGGRLTLRTPPTVTTHRLALRREGLSLAPWPRVYADLRLSGVRGEDAAEHLREVVRAG